MLLDKIKKNFRLHGKTLEARDVETTNRGAVRFRIISRETYETLFCVEVDAGGVLFSSEDHNNSIYIKREHMQPGSVFVVGSKSPDFLISLRGVVLSWWRCLSETVEIIRRQVSEPQEQAHAPQSATGGATVAELERAIQEQKTTTAILRKTQDENAELKKEIARLKKQVKALDVRKSRVSLN